MHRTTGGHQRAAALITPRGRFDAPSSDATPIRPVIAEALSWLAHIIDNEIDVRGIGVSIRDFAARHVGRPSTDLVAHTHVASGLPAQLLMLRLADLFDEFPPIRVIGFDEEEPPEYERLAFGDVTRSVPWHLAASFGAGTIAPVPVVVAVEPKLGTTELSVYGQTRDTEAARDALDAIVRDVGASENPFRGRCVSADADRHGTIRFEVTELPLTQRHDVVLPQRIWSMIDLHVHGLFAAHDRLARSGLASNRGVLLSGPPGTGKTALCRAIANELIGEVTIVMCSADIVRSSTRALYEQLVHLGPSLVVMEDVDLAIGHRASGAGTSLLDFLVALDGAMSRHRGVVTIATTNDVDSIDPAARRTSRFDCVIEVPRPDPNGRAQIIERYFRALDGFEIDVDTAAVARATAGSNGSDLRDLVSEAVLRVVTADGTAAVIDTELMIQLARARAHRAMPGQYL